MPSLSVQELDDNKFGLENVRICYSPFARTVHTAKVVASVLNIAFEGPQCKVIVPFTLCLFYSCVVISANYFELWMDDDLPLFLYVFSCFTLHQYNLITTFLCTMIIAISLCRLYRIFESDSLVLYLSSSLMIKYVINGYSFQCKCDRIIRDTKVLIFLI